MAVDDDDYDKEDRKTVSNDIRVRSEFGSTTDNDVL
jgi:hypothetical protein